MLVKVILVLLLWLDISIYTIAFVHLSRVEMLLNHIIKNSLIYSQTKLEMHGVRWCT